MGGFIERENVMHGPAEPTRSSSKCALNTPRPGAPRPGPLVASGDHLVTIMLRTRRLPLVSRRTKYMPDRNGPPAVVPSQVTW